LRQAEAGKKVGEICRELGVSLQASYSWKRRYAGLVHSENARLVVTMTAVRSAFGNHLKQELRPDFRQRHISHLMVHALRRQWRHMVPLHDHPGADPLLSPGNQPMFILLAGGE